MCRTEQLLSAAIETSNLDYASPDNQAERGFLGISPEVWGRVAIITALFAAVFWPNLRRLWLKTNPFTGEPNWSHAICVPIIGLYYLFVHREDLLKAHAEQFVWGRILRPSRAIASAVMIAISLVIYFLTNHHTGIAASIVRALGVSVGVLGLLVMVLDWSIATMLFGLGMFVYGIYPGQNDYLKDLGMVITLFGIVLVLCGWNVMKIAYFPIVFLICAIPWPGLVYSWVAEPLSTFAAQVAVHSLNMTGVDSVCSGTKIIIINANPMLPPRVLNVAEACAGMRSLMTFIAVAGAVAFLSPRPLWQKLIIVCSAIPIAIFCNVMRISGQGLLDHYVSPEWSESFAHQFVGMLMLLPAFLLILMVGYMLDKIFIEEADDTEFNSRVAPQPAAIQTRQVAMPALGAMPTSLAASPVLVKPRVPQPTASPAKPIAASANQPSSPRPAMVTPPRPLTAANMRSRAIPVNKMPGSPVNVRPTGAQPVTNGQKPPINPSQPRPPQARTVDRPNGNLSAANPPVTKSEDAP